MRGMGLRRLGATIGAGLSLLVAASAAQAQTPDFASSFTYTANLQPVGFSARAVPLDNAAAQCSAKSRVISV